MSVAPGVTSAVDDVEVSEAPRRYSELPTGVVDEAEDDEDDPDDFQNGNVIAAGVLPPPPPPLGVKPVITGFGCGINNVGEDDSVVAEDDDDDDDIFRLIDRTVDPTSVLTVHPLLNFKFPPPPPISAAKVAGPGKNRKTDLQLLASSGFGEECDDPAKQESAVFQPSLQSPIAATGASPTKLVPSTTTVTPPGLSETANGSMIGIGMLHIATAQGLYDFVSGGPEQLSFVSGERLWVLHPDNGDGWLHCANAEGTTGLVPSSYVQVD